MDLIHTIKHIKEITDPYSSKYSDNDVDDTDPASNWLRKYTYEGIDKWPSESIVKQLVNRYPIKEDTVVYRGMNFSTKEDWDLFYNNLKDNKETLNCSGVSSWSTSVETAEQFALTKPSYFLSKGTLHDYGIAQKTGERLSGYRGIIISTTLHAGQGIDVNASQHAHESEIIALSGEYLISVFRILKQFKHSIEERDIDINSVIMNTSKSVFSSKNSDEQLALFKYILQNHREQLNKKSRKHLFSLYFPKNPYTVNIIDLKDTKNWQSDHKLSTVFDKKIIMGFSFIVFILANDGLFEHEDLNKLRVLGNKIVDKYVDLIKTEPNAKIVTEGGIKLVAEFVHRSHDIQNISILNKYEQMNSKKEIDKINSLNDRDKIKAIDDYITRIKTLLDTSQT
jgi:hypothetical protein